MKTVFQYFIFWTILLFCYFKQKFWKVQAGVRQMKRTAWIEERGLKKMVCSKVWPQKLVTMLAIISGQLGIYATPNLGETGCVLLKELLNFLKELIIIKWKDMSENWRKAGGISLRMRVDHRNEQPLDIRGWAKLLRVCILWEERLV